MLRPSEAARRISPTTDLIPAEASSWPVDHFANPNAALPSEPFPAELSPVDLNRHHTAKQQISSWKGYSPTPLVPLADIASACGLGMIYAKDEGGRFQTGSFKSLGAPFAVCEILREVAAAHAGRHVYAEEIVQGIHKHAVAAVTIATASDGNHGVAVAWAARMFGCRSIVYMHGGVSEGRAQMIRDLGGVVLRCQGNYDESVRRCAADAATSGWPLVQDVSWDGYEQVPRWIYQGYTVLAGEIAEQLNGVPPTHVLINTGVGGFASAVCGHLWELWQDRRPRFITVEPTLADCVLRSGRAGELQVVPGDLDTIQAGLGCGEVASIAWDLLKSGTNDFVAVPDEVVGPTMRLLAGNSPPVIAGESAVAGLAVLVAAAAQPALKAKLGLDAESRVVVVVCEGATDPVIFEQCVGQSVQQVNASKFYTSLSSEARGMGKSAIPLPSESFRSTYQGQTDVKSRL